MQQFWKIGLESLRQTQRHGEVLIRANEHPCRVARCPEVGLRTAIGVTFRIDTRRYHDALTHRRLPSSLAIGVAGAVTTPMARAEATPYALTVRVLPNTLTLA